MDLEAVGHAITEKTRCASAWSITTCCRSSRPRRSQTWYAA